LKRVLFFVLFLAVIASSYAQTGPGGVGNSTGESSQPKNILWLDINNLSLPDGNDVLTWPDKSGHSNSLIASDITSPFFQSAVVNSLGSVLFNQTLRPDTRMYRTNVGTFVGSENTMIFVVRTTDLLDAWLSYATQDDAKQLLIKNSNNLAAHYLSGNSTTPGVDVNDGGWYIVIVQGRSSDGEVIMSKNGTEVTGSVTSGFSIEPNGTLWIGHQQNTIGGGQLTVEAFDGEMAEVISYSTYLNAAERIIVNNYLSAKFAIAITNDHYVGDDNGNGDYDFDVAGIGHESGVEHVTASSAGVTIFDKPGDLDSDGEFIFFGHDNAAATVLTSPADVVSGVEQRWNRDWYVDKTTGGTLGTEITFDLAEGVEGLVPQIADDYVLLKWSTAISKYEIVTVSAANKTISGSKIKFNVASADLVDGRYTLGTTDATNSPADGLPNKTWYAYQSGDWTNWQVWTLDGAQAPLLNNPNQEKPGA